MPLARLRITAAMLLILGLLGAPPASTAEAYQESPWLRDDVSAGRLPPVGERLPADPLVVDLKAQGKEIGKPGGTLRMMIVFTLGACRQYLGKPSSTTSIPCF